MNLLIGFKDTENSSTDFQWGKKRDQKKLNKHPKKHK